jgi:hypothetical protein
VNTIESALPQLKNFFNKGVASAKQVEKTAKLAALAAEQNKASIYRNISGNGESVSGPGTTGGGVGGNVFGGGGFGSSESGQQGDSGGGGGGSDADTGDSGDYGGQF